ncbi:Crp/Fnr family transcriptional regulator [Flavobacterium sp. '19STA2R22 D10 B1']|uniref:Crp/Fnr family transcriptional regulator n=1 Tax=Flavobacterium aerium TaxID=3037261 RepID=UPI00278C7885|nr:Crp/Fnr family transcriptional regulator [Flavobacterium sp. '19STA2R22 D10 B1']
MELILQNIARYIQLSSTEEKHFLSLLEQKNYKAKTIVLHSGDICEYSYFVSKGILRSYTIDTNCSEHVMSFACNNWWIADMYSLLSQQPGTLTIEVNDDADVLLLSKIKQEQLYIDIPQFERFFRIITENALVSNQQRIMDNLSLTAEARYDKFCTKYPELILNLPQKQIASYIGVTPEFFSRMRTKMLKNK